MEVKLSIVILSYNTKELLKECLESIVKYSGEVTLEVIVVDNHSTDGSVEMVLEFKKGNLGKINNLRLIKSEKNLGFAKGNNLAREVVLGKQVLFLNSDTKLHENTLKETVSYLDNHPDCGVVTCKMVLPSGELDKDARRRFPTPLVSVFRFSGFTGRYWYSDMNPNETAEIEVAQGAFFLTRKEILDNVGWFSEEYFLDGEDIDLSFKIHEAGWKIVYDAKAVITHVKKASKKNLNLGLKERLKYKMTGISSMEIFYRKHLWRRYPIFVNLIVIIGIKILKLIRMIKVVLNI